MALVNGATGAVGHAGFQIASPCGATVLADVSSPAWARDLLADAACRTIDLGAFDLRDSLRAQVQDTTRGHGADIVVNPLGGDVFDASLRALAWAGLIGSVGFAAGRIPEVKADYLLVKNISATGLHWTDYRDRAGEAWKMTAAHDELVMLWRCGAPAAAGEDPADAGLCGRSRSAGPVPASCSPSGGAQRSGGGGPAGPAQPAQ